MKTALFTYLVTVLLATGCDSTQNEINLPTVSKKTNTNDKTYAMCASFNLKPTDVRTYFENANQVDKGEFHHSAIILPCSVYGKIKIKGILYDWEIYAGGAGTLNANKISKQFLCKDKCCARLPSAC